MTWSRTMHYIIQSHKMWPSCARRKGSNFMLQHYIFGSRVYLHGLFHPAKLPIPSASSRLRCGSSSADTTLLILVKMCAWITPRSIQSSTCIVLYCMCSRPMQQWLSLWGQGHGCGCWCRKWHKIDFITLISLHVQRRLKYLPWLWLNMKWGYFYILNSSFPWIQWTTCKRNNCLFFSRQSKNSLALYFRDSADGLMYCPAPSIKSVCHTISCNKAATFLSRKASGITWFLCK